MTSEVDICNIALSNIRAGSISSLTETSLPAQVCNLKYNILRDRCLREIPWTFNHKIKPLSLLTTEVFNWAYAYQYPVDCLKINRLVGSYEELPSGSTDLISQCIDTTVLSTKVLRKQIPYEVFNFDNNITIGSDQTDLYIDYSAKITDTNLFDDDFIMALSHLISSEVAIAIVGGEIGRSFREDSLTLYRGYLASAMSKSMNDQYLEPSESEFITVRG